MRTTLRLFLFFQALYALTSSGNVFRVADEFEVYFQAEHLVDGGDSGDLNGDGKAEVITGAGVTVP